jgi:hypothetical protein
VEAHLLTFGRVQGWVFSAWGEASKEEHQLVQRLAKARLELLAQPPGQHGPANSKEAKLAALVTWVRRQLSFLAVQQQSRSCWTDCSCCETAPRRPGSGGTGQGRCRQARKEMRAQAVNLYQGQAIRRIGFGRWD